MATNLNLTKRSIEALPAPTTVRRAEYKDPKRRGLTLHVTQAGQKTFYLYRKIGGQPERIRIGVFPDTTLEMARKEVSRLNAAIDGGANPAEVRRLTQKEMTLGDLYQLYLNDHIRAMNKQERNVISYYKLYLRRWQSRKLSSITNGQIKRLHQRIAADKSGLTANRTLTLLRAMYNKAIDWEILSGQNPTDRIKKFPEKSRERFLQPDEFPRFFKAVNEEANTTIRDYILISLLTGARRTNAVEMRWEQINFEHGTWTIPVTKSGDSHTVPLVPEAMEILMARKSDSDSEWVFPGTGETGHLVEPTKAWRNILSRAGIKDLRLHDLRRTMGSWQASTGASLSVIGKSLAHKNVSTTAIYARLHLDPVRDAMSKATKAMMEAGKMKAPAKITNIRQV